MQRLLMTWKKVLWKRQVYVVVVTIVLVAMSYFELLANISSPSIDETSGSWEKHNKLITDVDEGLDAANEAILVEKQQILNLREIIKISNDHFASAADKTHAHPQVDHISKTDNNKTNIFSDNTCANSISDRPNWTVLYNDSVSTGSCPKIESQQWVKRIILANGTSIYKGCNKYSKKCRDHSYFDKKLKIRINTPPCCLKHTLDIFKDVTQRLADFKASYFLFGGGLIGWYRNRSPVPYDHDLDVIIDLKFWKSDQFKDLLSKLEIKHGYYVKKITWNKIKVYLSKKNHNFIDLWPFTTRGKSHVRIKSHVWKIHRLENILPLQQTNFAGLNILVPKNPAATLDLEYGKGKWEHELTCKNVGKFGNCIT